MRLPAVAATGVLLAALLPARADLIELRGGGNVRGVVLPENGKPGQILVQTETGSRPMVFQKSQVVRIIREASPLDAYFARRDKVEQTALAQYEFGQWCEQNKLRGLAEFHFQQAVDLDKTFGPAHKKLGHVLHDGQWITYDALREAQGMVKRRGKWVSRQEKAELEDQSVEATSQSNWTRRLRILHRKLTAGSNTERAEAEAELEKIHESAAVPGLVRVFGQESEAIRVKLAHVLGAIDGPESQAALVQCVLAEPDVDVRKATLDELARRKEKDGDTVTRFARGLTVTDPAIVGRAAWALAELGAVTTIPKLVSALVQVEQKTIADPNAGSGGGGQAISATSIQSQSLPHSKPGAPPSGFGTVQSVPILTGPVVGPGVVAYGATSVPLYSGATIGGGGGGIGVNSGGGGNGGPAVRVVRILHPNADVLAALEKLTGKNFEFDVDAWRHWLATGFRAEERPARRTPQPK
jgi:hypothetical protein